MGEGFGKVVRGGRGEGGQQLFISLDTRYPRLGTRRKEKDYSTVRRRRKGKP